MSELRGGLPPYERRCAPEVKKQAEVMFAEAKELSRFAQFGGPGHSKTQKDAAELRKKARRLLSQVPKAEPREEKKRAGFAERVLAISDEEMETVRKTQAEIESPAEAQEVKA